MNELAPGAAEAIRQILADKRLSNAQRERLVRLASEQTRSAWQELLRPHRTKKKLSNDELRKAQHEILWETYRAVDFMPIGGLEISQAKGRLEKIGRKAMELSEDISEVGDNAQMYGLWGLYRKNNRTDDLLMALPKNLLSLAKALKHVGDFFELAASNYKPEGPVARVGQPRDKDALKTTVIRQIAKVCKLHFGTVLYSTVATLANASLDRTDITRTSVRGSLRNANL